MRIATFAAISAMPYCVALERGYFKEAGIETQMGVHLGALQAGTFDAGYTLEPLASMMIKNGVARRLEAGVIATYLNVGLVHTPPIPLLNPCLNPFCRADS